MLPQVHLATPIGLGDPYFRSFAGNTFPQDRHLTTHRASVSAFDMPTQLRYDTMAISPMILWVNEIHGVLLRDSARITYELVGKGKCHNGAKNLQAILGL